MKLNELKPGQSARVDEVGGEGALRQHFLDMGVIPGRSSPWSSWPRWAIRWSFASTDMS